MTQHITRILFSIIIAFLASTVSTKTHAQSRHALVVGIDNYQNVPVLQKARNDARSVHTALEQTGFEAELLLDSDGITFLQELERFARRIGPGDEVVFFFAGHGVELGGENILLPADIPAPDSGGDLLVRRFGIPVQDVLNQIKQRGARLNLLILDACRDNPFPKQGTRSLGAARGLARIDAPEGAYIMYSAGAGQSALDRLSDQDPDPNSVFTRTLLPRLTTPGLRLRDMVLEVRSEVRKLAMSVGHDQFPAVYDQLDGSFQFVPKSVKPQPEMEPCGIAESIWRALSDSNDVAALSAFATTYSLICPEIAEAARERLSDLDTEKSQVSVADQTTKRSDAELYRVRPEGALNARTGPSAETAILRTLDPGTRIRELEREGDWSKVVLPDDSVGWVHNGFIVTENEYDRRITLTQPNAEMIAESAPLDNASDVDQVFEAAAFRVRPEGALNARVGPSAEDEILRVLPAGTELREVERQGDWSRVVLPDDASGWVHNGFIVTEEDYEMRLAAMKQTEDGKTEDAPLKNGASFRIPRGLLAQPSGEIDLMNVCAWGYSQYSVDFVYTSSSRFLGGATNLAKGMVPDEATWQRCYMLDNPCVATGSIGATFHIGAGRTIKDAIAALETRFRSSGVAAGCR